MTLHFEASSVNKATLRAYQDNSMKRTLDHPIGEKTKELYKIADIQT